MKLYVGTYHKYNCGSIDGAWLNLDDYASKEEFLTACQKLHSDERNPEFMFQDFEVENSLEEQFYCESYIDDDYWTIYKDATANCGIDLDAIGDYLALHNYEIVPGIKAAEESYCGTYEDAIEFAQSEVSECYPEIEKNLPNFIYNAIDWEHVARELSYDYDYIATRDYKTAVFRNF